MQLDKLQSIIAQKNANLERDALNRASSIIDDIAELQQGINDANSQIAKLRNELVGLEIAQHDAKTILGNTDPLNVWQTKAPAAS